MTDQIPTLSGPTRLLSEGGAQHHAPFASLDAFRLALRLGATSLGARAFLTADGELVLAKDDSIGLLRRKRISSMARAELPDPIASLDELFDAAVPEIPLAVSVADDVAFEIALAIARAQGGVDRGAPGA